ncbi:MAG: PHP domain-containing protein, partial [bacterium]|nr:PHP domain-containing protein [bacterium]
MTNIEIAKLLRKVAAAYTILNENHFKITAYENAATAVEHATVLADIPGVGSSIAGHLEELLKTGKVKHWEEVFTKVPKAMFPLLDIPGIGPKTAYKLVTQLKLKSEQNAIEKVKEYAIEHNKSSLVKSVIAYEKGSVKDNRININLADKIAQDIITYLGEGVALGSLRRRVATIGDIDIAVKHDLKEKFENYPHKNEIQVDFRISKPEEWGSMMQYFTGSKYHNIKLRELAMKKGLKVNEYGISGKKFSNEKDFYNYLGLEYIPPELREDQGEFEMPLPKLIELKDVKGDLHMHSSYNDEPNHDLGENTMEEMLAKAKEIGYEYIAFSEHNPKKDSDIINILKRRFEVIEQLKKSTRSVRVVNLLEVDISPSGELNLPIGSDKYLDGILVSIHSEFRQDKDIATARVLKALTHPLARIFAHPTGRLLGKREGIELDWDQIFEFCSKNKRAVEINATPSRLDLPDVLVREAIKHGVLLSIGTDAHSVEGLENMPYGIDV